MAPWLRSCLLLSTLAATASSSPAHPFSLAQFESALTRHYPISASSSSSSQALEKRSPPKKKTPKYFHEAGGTLELGHYDGRYFDKVVPYEEHRYVLRDLIRSYLTVMAEYGVETWLAHGTLLGWWWNGKIMPWDYDLDVQVSNTTLQWIGDHLNQTDHFYNSTTFPTANEAQANTTNHHYFLDINPHHVELDRGDGQNIIDGRWIDMDNGMFIDITGIRERMPHKPGVWSCKNAHKYKSQELWPMRVTEFEGAKARIPYNFEKILSDEYGYKSLVVEEFHDHRWDPDIRDWVKMSDEEEAEREEAAKEKKKQLLEASNRSR